MANESITPAPNVFYFVSGEQLQAFGHQCAMIAVSEAEAAWKRQHDEMFEPVFTKQDVADIFKTSVRNIDEWIANRRIIPTKIGGIVRFDGEEIARVKAVHKMRTKPSINN